MTPKEVLALCREKDVKAVDMRFMDFPGLWQHFTIPVGALEEETFEDGLGFDGSSILGFVRICESDMILRPDPATYAVTPWTPPELAPRLVRVLASGRAGALAGRAPEGPARRS